MGRTVTLISVVRHRAEIINANDVDVIEQSITKNVKRKIFSTVASKPTRK
jgi:hypothetical protein